MELNSIWKVTLKIEGIKMWVTETEIRQPMGQGWAGLTACSSLWPHQGAGSSTTGRWMAWGTHCSNLVLGAKSDTSRYFASGLLFGSSAKPVLSLICHMARFFLCDFSSNSNRNKFQSSESYIVKLSGTDERAKKWSKKSVGYWKQRETQTVL